jgi:hypothetical protein
MKGENDLIFFAATFILSTFLIIFSWFEFPYNNFFIPWYSNTVFCCKE